MKKLKLFFIFSIIIAVVISLSVIQGCVSSKETTEKTSLAEEPEVTEAPMSETEPTESSEDRYYKLTKEDVLSFYSPIGLQEYTDISMDRSIPSADASELEFTESEIEQLKSMNLKIGLAHAWLDDAAKWFIMGAEGAAKELGIDMANVWIGKEGTGASQLEDFAIMSAITDEYDAYIVVSVEYDVTSQALIDLVEKIPVVFHPSAPLGIDWNHPNYIGVSTPDTYLEGIKSAEGAARILNYKGTIGTGGWEVGRTGGFPLGMQIYNGWTETFAKYPDIKLVQVWWDDPGNAKPVIAGQLAANPEIELMLIDWTNPPADQAQALYKEMGYTAWKDMVQVTIDTDNTIVIPMALDGPDNNYTAAFIGGAWTESGRDAVYMYGKYMLYGGDNAPKFVASPPLPLTTYENLKFNYVQGVPKDWEIPQAILDLDDSLQYGFTEEELSRELK